MAIPVIVSVLFRLQSALSASTSTILKKYCIFDTGLQLLQWAVESAQQHFGNW